jgi:GNAT superfamily N-acetyltransferase
MKYVLLILLKICCHLSLFSNETFTNLDSSILHYQIIKKKIFSVHYIEQISLETSDDLIMQQILACARSRGCKDIEIPRHVLASPINCLAQEFVKQTKFTIKNLDSNFSIVAYPQLDTRFVRELHYNKEEIEETNLQDIIQHDDALLYRLFAIDHDKKILGGLKLNHDWYKKKAAIIEFLYVGAPFRKKHIGTRLLETAKELAQAYDKDHLRLLAVPYGENAMSLNVLKEWYKKRGFLKKKNDQWLYADAAPNISLNETFALHFKSCNL